MSPVIYLVAILGIAAVVACARLFGEQPTSPLTSEEEVLQALKKQYPEFQSEAVLLGDDRAIALVRDGRQQLVSVFSHGLFVVARKLQPDNLVQLSWKSPTELSMTFSEYDKKEYALQCADASETDQTQWQAWLDQWRNA